MIIDWIKKQVGKSINRYLTPSLYKEIKKVFTDLSPENVDKL